MKPDYRELADVVVSTGDSIIEIEIKVSKQDLIKGEARKKKHGKEDSARVVNKFFVCVPTELVEVAKKWVEEVNPKYGIIEFITERAKEKWSCRKARKYIHIVKNAKVLQPKHKKMIEDKILKR